jgi:hypothetical protein
MEWPLPNPYLAAAFFDVAKPARMTEQLGKADGILREFQM